MGNVWLVAKSRGHLCNWEDLDIIIKKFSQSTRFDHVHGRDVIYTRCWSVLI